jgi:hypothetical protein
VQNEYLMDWIAGCIEHMNRRGLAAVEPTEEAEAAWTAHVADVSANLLRRQVRYWMVHVNEDGSRLFMPYAGGMGQYVQRATKIAENDYDGFRFDRITA